MITEPKLENRTEQPYVGIRTQVPMSEFPNVIPQLLDEVFGWLGKQGIEPAGAPFIRYHVINMSSNMDVEMGVPVASPVSGDGRVQAGVIPAGRYGSLVYTGNDNGMDGNKALIDWAEQKGLVWDNFDSTMGHGFASRVEFFLTDPDDEPDPAKWETEVAIRLADKQP